MPAADRLYHTLLMRQLGPWEVVLGDFDRAVVVYERNGLVSGSIWTPQRPRMKDMRIITTGALQADIDAAVTALNGGTKK